MSAIATAIAAILVITTMISTWWTWLGIPAAIVFAIIRAKKKDKEQKKRYKKFILISLGGIPVLILSFVLYFVLTVALSFFGISLISNPIPKI